MRDPLDRYYTPSFAVDALIENVPELHGQRLLDPCCGDGTMSNLVGKKFLEVFTNDIDPSACAMTHLDLRRRALWETIRPTWTVTNPPFSLLGEALRLALDHSQYVAMLLRMSVLEVCKGREYLALNPPAKQIVLPRIRFRGTGTDSVTTCWFLWPPVGKSLSGPPIVCIPKRNRKETRGE